MDTSLVLLDIPQGVVTFASAVLAAFVLVIVALASFGFRLLYSIQGQLAVLKTSMAILERQDIPRRVAALEPQFELIRLSFRHGQIPNLRGVPAPGNPMAQERWDELARKLDKEVLTEEEAREFHAALLERREQAIQEKDTATLVIVGAGIAFTEWQLKEKELREQK